MEIRHKCVKILEEKLYVLKIIKLKKCTVSFIHGIDFLFITVELGYHL